MERKSFIKNSLGVIALGLLKPADLLKSEDDSLCPLLERIDQKNPHLHIEHPFQCESHAEIANKYFSETVKAFKQCDLQILPERPDLQFAAIGLTVYANEVKDVHIEKICKMINIAAEKGYIEYGHLASVGSVKLAGPGSFVGIDVNGNKQYLPSSTLQRYFLFFYSYSKYSLEQRKAFNKDLNAFIREGEIPKPQ